MTPVQVELVQSSWTKVVPIADTAAKLFYDKLFELNPNLKFLFSGDMVQQGEKLMKTIGTAVASLSNLEAILPVVKELGSKHTYYGVVDEDYATVGEALIWTLKTGLGDAFTKDVEEAWVLTYTTLADIMKEAAKGVTEETPISHKHKLLVMNSWKQVVPIADTAADIFYETLFSLDPSLKSLFPDDMKSQKEKLMKTLGVAVNGLNNVESIIPVLQDLGKRHVDYKVKEDQYPTVGKALLLTLEKGLGDAFTEDVKEAWTQVYTVVSSVMIEASKTAQKGWFAKLKEKVLS